MESMPGAATHSARKTAGTRVADILLPGESPAPRPRESRLVIRTRWAPMPRRARQISLAYSDIGNHTQGHKADRSDLIASGWYATNSTHTPPQPRARSESQECYMVSVTPCNEIFLAAAKFVNNLNLTIRHAMAEMARALQ